MHLAGGLAMILKRKVNTFSTGLLAQDDTLALVTKHQQHSMIQGQSAGWLAKQPKTTLLAGLATSPETFKEEPASKINHRCIQLFT